MPCSSHALRRCDTVGQVPSLLGKKFPTSHRLWGTASSAVIAAGAVLREMWRKTVYVVYCCRTYHLKTSWLKIMSTFSLRLSVAQEAERVEVSLEVTINQNCHLFRRLNEGRTCFQAHSHGYCLDFVLYRLLGWEPQFLTGYGPEASLSSLPRGPFYRAAHTWQLASPTASEPT